MKKYLFITICAVLSVSGSILAKEYPAKKVNEKNQKQLKNMSAACQLGSTVTEISLNNVRTWVHMDGLLW